MQFLFWGQSIAEICGFPGSGSDCNSYNFKKSLWRSSPRHSPQIQNLSVFLCFRRLFSKFYFIFWGNIQSDIRDVNVLGSLPTIYWHNLNNHCLIKFTFYNFLPNRLFLFKVMCLQVLSILTSSIEEPFIDYFQWGWYENKKKNSRYTKIQEVKKPVWVIINTFSHNNSLTECSNFKTVRKDIWPCD